jgi:hypothetical protein
LKPIAQVAGSAVAYGLYSATVDLYAHRKVKAMQEIPLLVSAPVIHPRSLRKTISKLTNLVENPRNRKSWNAWMTSPPKSSLSLSPGTYGFAYRSYVNFEEKGAIASALFSCWYLFGFTAARKGQMVVDQNGKSVRLVDHFRHRLITPIKITWNGYIKTRLGKKQIVWTDTEMVFGKKVIKNPAVSELLRQIPWKVVKVEDGMAAFQRGDVGMLAYDREN